MLGVYDYTVILTYISLWISIGGMMLSLNGHLDLAVLCLALSGLCDMFDGKIARTKKDRTEIEKRFGIQIDSLCDIVCFGVGPAIICYCMGMNGIVGVLKDIGVYTTVDSAAEIQDCHNPYDSFALHKAALIACGIIPVKEEADLQEILKRMGGGIYLSTQVYGVPKGSGLGTSSILSGACVKGIFEFLGQERTDAEIYDVVLGMEQIMSTGGGWQDQVGGLTEGIKLISTKPGIAQNLVVEKIEMPEEGKKELKERFALIYTGQRRLARNLLRDVVGGYIGSRPESLKALKEMKAIAVLMRFALEQGDIDEFAELLNQHWKLSCMLDAGTTNTCIDQILLVCEDLIDGKFISGAGGGGFIQVILKKDVTKEQLHERLHGVFQDSGVDVWDCELLV